LVEQRTENPCVAGSIPAHTTKTLLKFQGVFLCPYIKNLVMNNSNTHHERFAKMTFASVYPLYVTKVEKKGRTKEELLQVIEWLTGFNKKQLQDQIDKQVTFEKFFQNATLNTNARLITGVICGYRIEEIENPLTKKLRYLDKLVDELAKGRKMEKILRNVAK
jgi:hypothetical protein